MSKNKNKSTVANNGPGRPRFTPKIPQGRFTLRKFCEFNGVNPDTGKGDNCSRLTLIQFINRDAAEKKNKSVLVKLPDTVKPHGEKGLGRKAFLYCRREKLATLNTKDSTKAPKAKASKVSVDVGTSTADYEAQKAALLAPTPAVDITPTAPEETPAVAPEAAPAEVAPAAETVTETVTA